VLWLKTTKLPPKGVIHLFQHVSRIKLFASKDLWTILAPFGSGTERLNRFLNPLSAPLSESAAGLEIGPTQR
jgi:hypothetical protein